MPRISHFDIPVDNPQRAQKFYSDVFDQSERSAWIQRSEVEFVIFSDIDLCFRLEAGVEQKF